MSAPGCDAWATAFLISFITVIALFTAAVATFNRDVLPFKELAIVERTPWSDFIVSAIDQVDALSAALEIFRPVEISFCVFVSEC